MKNGSRRPAVGGRRQLDGRAPSLSTAYRPFDVAHGPERAERVEGLPPTAYRSPGFTLVELLVAMFVLALAMAGAIAVVHSASRNAVGARSKVIAEELARTALADAAYTAEWIREDHSGQLCLQPIDAKYGGAWKSGVDDLKLAPEGYQRNGWRDTGRSFGWLWRAHSYANGLYSLDVWVYANPGGSGTAWSPTNDVERAKAVLYLRSALESRK